MRIVLILATILGFFVATFSFAYLALYATASGNYSVPLTITDDKTLPRIEAGGKVFHGETYGDPANPVIVVLHGGPGWDYKSLLPLKTLADNYFVVFYDQTGGGLSPRVPNSDVSLDSTISDLDSIVDKYSGGKKVNLLGHSWGAMLAAGYMGKHPDKVHRAVLAEPGFLTAEQARAAGVRFGPLWTWDFMWFAAKKWVEARKIQSQDPDAQMDYFFGQVAPQANPEYYCGGILPPPALDFFRAGPRAGEAIINSARGPDGTFNLDLTRGLDKFTEPVLFIASDCNSMIGTTRQKEYMKFFPNARMVVIMGAGHQMIGEKPAETLTAIREYLAQ